MAKQQILQKIKHNATYVLMNLGEASAVQSVLCSFEEIILSASIESTLIVLAIMTHDSVIELVTGHGNVFISISK